MLGILALTDAYLAWECRVHLHSLQSLATPMQMQMHVRNHLVVLQTCCL